MKIKPEHLNHIRQSILEKRKAIGAPTIAAYRAQLNNDPRVKDVEKRLRWDILHGAVPSKWVCDNLYPYLNDTHIDTALRALMVELSPAMDITVNIHNPPITLKGPLGKTTTNWTHANTKNAITEVRQ